MGLALKLDGATFRKRKLRVERSTKNPQKPMAIAPKKGMKMKVERKTDKVKTTTDETISFCFRNDSWPSLPIIEWS